MIKLRTDSILQVPLEKYNKDFTFIVNSENFKTSSFVADLISPNISSRHLVDPTLNEFKINTKYRGDFNKIINLISFKEEKIDLSDFPFIFEVFDQLGTEKVDIQNDQKIEEITASNVIDLIKYHQNYPHFFSSDLTREIEFISSHFTDLKEKVLDSVSNEESDSGIHEDVIEQIISHDDLQLDSETELLDFVIGLYLKNRKFSCLFEFVIFENVEVESMREFARVFDVNDLTVPTWKSLITRLQQPISIEKSDNDEASNEFRVRKRKYKKKSSIEIKPRENEFNGLIKYLQTHSDIKNEVDITYSSINDGDPFNLFQYEDNENRFRTKNRPNSWICFEFKTHKIIPSSYIIRSFNFEKHNHPKSWVLEGSNDNENWTQLDKQSNNGFLNGANRVHLFSIQNYMSHQPFKYLRFHQIGPNWYSDNNHFLQMNSIEFYGLLI